MLQYMKWKEEGELQCTEAETVECELDRHDRVEEHFHRERAETGQSLGGVCIAVRTVHCGHNGDKILCGGVAPD